MVIQTAQTMKMRPNAVSEMNHFFKALVDGVAVNHSVCISVLQVDLR